MCDCDCVFAGVCAGVLVCISECVVAFVQACVYIYVCVCVLLRVCVCDASWSVEKAGRIP